MHHSMSLISCAGCLGLSPVISAYTHPVDVCRSLKSQKNSLKTCYFSASRSFKVIDVGTHGKAVSSACHHKQQVSSFTRFEGGTQIWRNRTEDFLNKWGRTLHCTLSWSISSGFHAVHSWNVCGSLKCEKLTENPYFGVQGRSRSSMLVSPESTSAVLVTMQQVCVYLQPASCYTTCRAYKWNGWSIPWIYWCG